jgi:hypothetical protein
VFELENFIKRRGKEKSFVKLWFSAVASTATPFQRGEVKFDRMGERQLFLSLTLPFLIFLPLGTYFVDGRASFFRSFDQNDRSEQRSIVRKKAISYEENK